MAQSMDIRESDRRIGESLARLRRERGIRQSELAQLLHSSQSMVSKIEAGGRTLRVRELPAYATALGMDAQELATAVLDSLADDTELSEGE
ncbi:MAG: helix-turn-helix transcriptional regulator [Coriobacteriales bacterium]|nr:helix-turn-helix transcriptional regulator [Coriobacteriales bacterium]